VPTSDGIQYTKVAKDNLFFAKHENKKLEVGYRFLSSHTEDIMSKTKSNTDAESDRRRAAASNFNKSMTNAVICSKTLLSCLGDNRFVKRHRSDLRRREAQCCSPTRLPKCPPLLVKNFS
jgi:hypothetical protein